MSQPPVDLALLARQQRQFLTEMGEMRVMMAILQRLDRAVSGLVNWQTSSGGPIGS